MSGEPDGDVQLSGEEAQARDRVAVGAREGRLPVRNVRERGIGLGSSASLVPPGSAVSTTSRTRLVLLDARDPRVASIWRALEVAARPVYFQTWSWIEAWLRALPPEVLPQLAVISRNGAVVAACFLGRRTQFRHGLLPVRGRYLNTTGVEGLDELLVEHNGLLCAPGEVCQLGALVELLPRDWDELVLPAVGVDAFGPHLDPRYRLRVTGEVVAPFVDLARVRAAGDYLKLLSANTRSQIRRARKVAGPLVIEVASSAAHASEIYDELVALHTASWRERGEPGVFADPWFDRFHRGLIAERIGHGEIDLVRLRAGNRTIGCTYNLIANGRVLFYQSGLARFDDPHMKPGYLCQAAAIERAAAAGHAVYDLLAGESRYKSSLSTGATPLTWLRVQRRLARFAIEDQLRVWKRAYVAWCAARAR